MKIVSIITSDRDVFIQSMSSVAKLTCNYTVKIDDKLIFGLNESVEIEKYEWFQDGVNKSEGQYLFFNGINQQQDSGIYQCQIKLKNAQLIKSDSFNLTVSENTNQPDILNATCLNENQIYLKWGPNRETAENTRYRIEVIYKDESIPSFLYPGCLYYLYYIEFSFNIQSI